MAMRVTVFLMLMISILNPLAAQLYNGDFEHWVREDGKTEPVGWFVINQDDQGNTVPLATASEDGLNRSTSLLLTNRVNPQGDTLIAIAASGCFEDGDFQGIPFSGQPSYLKGYYQYSPSGNDQAHLFVCFYKEGNIVAVQEIWFPAAETNFMPFYLPLTFSAEPDRALIMVRAGSQAGSALQLDNLSFSSPPGPNPAAVESASIQSPSPFKHRGQAAAGPDPGDQ